jgi:hypothetical protein
MIFAWSSPEAFSATFNVAVTSSAFMVAHSFQADDVAREVVEDGRQVEPAPTDDFQIGVSRPGGLHPGPSQNRT